MPPQQYTQLCHNTPTSAGLLSERVNKSGGGRALNDAASRTAAQVLSPFPYMITGLTELLAACILQNPRFRTNSLGRESTKDASIQVAGHFSQDQ